MSTSSADPAKLAAFERTMGGIDEAMRIRAGILADALDDYQVRCSGPHRVTAVADTDHVLRSWARGAGELGTWVGDVGRAFIKADAIDAFIGGPPDPAEVLIGPGTGPAGVRTSDDRDLLDHLSHWTAPLRGVRPGEAARLAADLGIDRGGDGPPAWHQHLEAGGSITHVATAVADGIARSLADAPDLVHVRIAAPAALRIHFPDGPLSDAVHASIQAKLRLPTASAARLGTAAKWLGRASNAATFFTAAHEQWQDDRYLDGPQRTLHAALRGGGRTGFGIAGAAGGLWAGGQISPVCGPATPVCALGFGVTGALAGGFLGSHAGDRFVDAFPGLNLDDSGHVDQRADHLAETIAHSDDQPDPTIAAAVDLWARDLATTATADDPPHFASPVARLLPDHDLLHAAAHGNQPPPSTTTTGTTIPTWSEQDPWPTGRPYQ